MLYNGYRLKGYLPQTMLFMCLMNIWLMLDDREEELTSEEEGNCDNNVDNNV